MRRRTATTAPTITPTTAGTTTGTRAFPTRFVAVPWIAAGLALGVGLAACGDDADDDSVATAPSDDPPATGPRDVADPGEFDESLIVGLPVDEAQQVVEDEGWEFRVAVIDGEDQMLTMDYVENRVNVAVVDGVVEGIETIG